MGRVRVLYLNQLGLGATHVSISRHLVRLFQPPLCPDNHRSSIYPRHDDGALAVNGTENSTMARLDDLLRQMKQQGASDLHMAAGSAPYMRINGEMAKLNYRSVSPETSQSLIFEILNETQRQHFEENWDLDLSYALKGVGRFRANIFMQRNGIGAAFRLIPEGIKTVRELDLPEQLVDLMDVSEGLILLTGPTGAGKTTTLAALIHSINVEQQKHIITIEDPIEFVD